VTGWAVAGVLATLACGRPPATPADVVTAYFRALGRDPARTLDLVSPGFHLRHGLRLAVLEGVFWGRWRGSEAPPDLPYADRDPEVEDAAAALDGARLAWLFVQRPRFYRETAGRLEWRIRELEVGTDLARVRVHVTGPSASSFVQRFRLQRSGRWRIDEIGTEGVRSENVVDAFVAAPSLELLPGLRDALSRTRAPSVAGGDAEGP
jgi:hypothetical protein